MSLGIAHKCDLHAHTAVQLSIALAGTFRVRLGPDRPWTRCSAVVIPSERQHEVDGGGEPVATLYLDPSTAVARALTPYAKHRIRYFAADQIADLLPRLWTAADAPVRERVARRRSAGGSRALTCSTRKRGYRFVSTCSGYGWPSRFARFPPAHLSPVQPRGQASPVLTSWSARFAARSGSRRPLPTPEYG